MKNILLLIFLVLTGATVVCSIENPAHLFIIGHSINANIVRYDVNMTKDGKINPKKPVIAYWEMLAKDGRKEKLNELEHKAYGFHCKYDEKAKAYKLTINSYKRRKITLYRDGNVIKPRFTIAGKKAFLKRIFVTSRKGEIFPRVVSLEFYGTDIKTGKELYEKISIK